MDKAYHRLANSRARRETLKINHSYVSPGQSCLEYNLISHNQLWCSRSKVLSNLIYMGVPMKEYELLYIGSEK